MEILRDGTLAFLCAVGLCTLIWLLSDLCLRPQPPLLPKLLLVLPLTGEALTLERDLKLLRPLAKELPTARLILADCGLSPTGKALAQHLARESSAEFADAAAFPPPK